MQAHYTRLFTNDQGVSCIEDLAIDLESGFSAPNVKHPILSAPFLAAESSFWLGVPATWKDDALHPAPRRMVLVMTQGELQVATSDGVIRRFPVGSVVLVEDTAGVGHSTKVTSGEDAIIFAVGLPAPAP